MQQDNSVIKWLLKSLKMLFIMLKLLEEKLLQLWMLSMLLKKMEKLYMVMEHDIKKAYCYLPLILHTHISFFNINKIKYTFTIFKE